jgi:predicted amidohydrolase
VGTLRPGANADVAILDLGDDDYTLRDTDGNMYGPSAG